MAEGQQDCRRRGKNWISQNNNDLESEINTTWFPFLKDPSGCSVENGGSRRGQNTSGKVKLGCLRVT